MFDVTVVADPFKTWVSTILVGITLGDGSWWRGVTGGGEMPDTSIPFLSHVETIRLWPPTT